MHLTTREQERLVLAAGADLARRRLARGARLGAAESVALVCDEILEWAWDGVELDEIVARAAGVVPRHAILPGVADLVPFVQLEALFPYGSVLVHVPHPFGAARGSVRPGADRIELAPGRQRGRAIVHHRGHDPIWISSHTPLESLNPALVFELPSTPSGARWRLDAPSGMSHRFEPGTTTRVDVVEIEVST